MIINAFSVNMLPAGGDSEVRFIRLSLEESKDFARNVCGWNSKGELDSAIGHADTAAVVADLLGMSVGASRVNVTLTLYSPVLLAQYKGPRLPEGTVKLPEGAAVEFYRVELIRHSRLERELSEGLARDEARRRESSTFREGDDYGGSGFGRNIGND